jgi:hypothetical protein
MKTMLYALLITALPAAAQQTSGVIEYEMTARVEAGQFRVVTMGPGGAPAPANMPPPDLPDIITTKQTLTFSGGKGKIETEGMSNRVVMMSAGSQAAGGNITVAASPAAGIIKNETLRPPVSNATYIDLANRKYLSVAEDKTDSTVKAVWYAEEDYKQPGEFKTSGKTKTIAGYKCRRATVKLGEESFVVWYTEDIPVLFSPVNGVLPDKGVVLSIESSKRSYVAKKVTLKPVAETEVSLPGDATQLTPAELKEKRRQIIEKFHNDQFEKLR